LQERLLTNVGYARTISEEIADHPMKYRSGSKARDEMEHDSFEKS